MKRFQPLDLYFAGSAIPAVISVYALVYNHKLPSDEDRYFNFSWPVFSILHSIPFLLIALVYFIFRKKRKPLNQSLGTTHYILTILPYIAFFLMVSLILRGPISDMDKSTRMQYADSVMEASMFTILLYFIGQVLFLINIIVTLFKKKKPSSNLE
ncbi:MAG TPA: hypothetical protein VFF27_06465 [Bacteroidia bacterium]|jgi:amino acid permease|nr:hypothetical protein [Bacteroidia bacterium]